VVTAVTVTEGDMVGFEGFEIRRWFFLNWKFKIQNLKFKIGFSI
jgi:hypothetical protein